MKDSQAKERLESLKTLTGTARLEVAEGLAAEAASLVGPLTEALKHPDWQVRWGAVHALGKGGVREAAPALRPLLQDPQRRVGRTAAWALGRLKDAGAIPLLAEAARSEDRRLASTAAWALGHIGTAEALDALTGALDEAPPGAVRSLSIAFSEIGPEASGTLVQLLQEGTITERTRAAGILSRFGAGAVDLLLPLLQSPEVKHRRAAAHVLGTLKLQEKTEGAETALLAALEDEDDRVRRNAARSLGVLESQEARPALEKMLCGKPEDIRIAANALAALGDPAAGEALQAVIEEEATVQPAVEAAVRRALQTLGLEVRSERSAPPTLTKKELPTRNDYQAYVTPGLEAVAWEEIAGRMPGAALLEFGPGTVRFRWNGSPQAGAILRSVRRLFHGGAVPKEIALAKRLRRYRVCSLPASLEPTTAFCLARLCNLGERDIFLDLTCGSATIAIERALDGPALRISAGDSDRAAIECARENILAGAQPVRLLQWDARCLPLPAASVTAVAANLPYGRRSGSHQENLSLYPALVQEAARVLRSSGTAVFLTADKRLMRQCLENQPEMQVVSEREIETGGLRPSIFVVQKS